MEDHCGSQEASRNIESSFVPTCFSKDCIDLYWFTFVLYNVEFNELVYVSHDVLRALYSLLTPWLPIGSLKSPDPL